MEIFIILIAILVMMILGSWWASKNFIPKRDLTPGRYMVKYTRGGHIHIEDAVPFMVEYISHDVIVGRDGPFKNRFLTEDERRSLIYVERVSEIHDPGTLVEDYADYSEQYSPVVKITPPRMYKINGHVLYQASDFTEAEYERRNPIARNVIDGGLSICKICGGAEEELRVPCFQRQKLSPYRVGDPHE